MASSSHALTMTAISSMLIPFFVFLLSGGLAPLAHAQQPYGSAIADCGNQHNDTGLLGYFCGARGSSAPSCPTYLTFNARPPYSDFASIAALLGVDAAALTTANGGDLAPGSTRKVLVPATCSCTSTPWGRFYQRNATYVARPGDTLLIIANNTFQGLSSCQAVQAQGLGGAPATSLDAEQAVVVPLRCACPSAAQAAAGARFLVSYLVGEFDDLSSVAARFGVDFEAVARPTGWRRRTPSSLHHPARPVAKPPNVSQIQSSPPPPPPPPVARLAAVAAIAAAGAFLALKARRRRRRAGTVVAATATTTAPANKKKEGNNKGNYTSSSAYTTTTTGGEVSVSHQVVAQGVHLRGAERGDRRLQPIPPPRPRRSSSVYRADFNGDAAAVEVVDRDVAAEVEITRKINHLNLVRLVGLGHHHGRWYLVTEFAEHGSLRDRLRLLAGAAAGDDAPLPPPPLSWEQRVQVALDVAEGLRYLHEYAHPPCVHMDVSSGSVLLAGAGPRAKLRGFGAARAIAGVEGAGESAVMFTMTSRIAGTRGYMAPEYLEHGVVSPKADVYSLGVVLLELLTAKGVEELVGDGVGDPFAALRELADQLDGVVEDDGDGNVQRRLEELVDPAMGSCPLDAVVMMVRLIERCVRRDAAGRPSTGEVAQRLLKLSGVSAVGWQSSRSSPESPRSPGK
ncbi:hypothetical protein EJB05_27304, partial [Eragrostis curvula]